MSNDKVKGLLKGLRFISQIFDNNNEKEPQIEIGHPTDVRHVAHIGLDVRGPSESSPSWMKEFKSDPGISPAPPNLNDDTNCKRSGSSSKLSADSRSMNSRDQEKDSAELPKTSRKHSNSKVNIIESQAKEKSDKPRQTKRSSKHSQPNNDSDSIQLQGSSGDLPSMGQQESPKKVRPKKIKDASSKVRSKSQTKDLNSNEGAHSRSSSKTRNKNRSNEEDEQVERSNMSSIQTNQ